MIKLNKKQEPNILKNNCDSWKNDLMSYVNSGTKIPDSVQNKYNHVDVKDVLKEETNNKCMYCESTVAHIAHEHIEHFRPKAKDKYPYLTYEWSNLGLACPKCNMNKGDTFDENCQFINPYTEDPDNYFVALGYTIWNKLNNPRAELSLKIIELNRPELIEKRKERLELIQSLVEKWDSTSNPTLKDILKSEIEKEIANDKPYSMCAKSLVKALMNS